MIDSFEKDVAKQDFKVTIESVRLHIPICEMDPDQYTYVNKTNFKVANRCIIFYFFPLFRKFASLLSHEPAKLQFRRLVCTVQSIATETTNFETQNLFSTSTPARLVTAKHLWELSQNLIFILLIESSLWCKKRKYSTDHSTTPTWHFKDVGQLRSQVPCNLDKQISLDFLQPWPRVKTQEYKVVSTIIWATFLAEDNNLFHQLHHNHQHQPLKIWKEFPNTQN